MTSIGPKFLARVALPWLVLAGLSPGVSANAPAPDYFIHCDMELRRCAERVGTTYRVYGFDDLGNWWRIY